MTAPRPPETLETFESPAAPPWVLDMAPRLESWDAVDHPAQIAIRAYLAHISDLTSARMDALNGLVGLKLTVGLPQACHLIGGGRDLDNYLYPIVRRLGPARFVSVWAEKVHGRSSLTIGPVAAANTTAGSDWQFVSVRTSASATSRAWKEQIADEVAECDSGDGPIEVQVAFVVDPRRNWATLWKPAIDSLGGILGLDDRRAPFHPRDDRIVSLGLHVRRVPHMGWDVTLGVWWRPAGVSLF